MQSDLSLLIWIAVVLVGPPVLLVWLVRRRHQRERLARLPPSSPHDPKQEAPAAESVANDLQTNAPSSGGYRFPYGLPLILYPMLAIGFGSVASRAAIMGITLVSAILAIAFARQAFSRASFDAVVHHDPTMSLLTWRINWLLFFALPPGALAIAGVLRLAMA
ncbi:MAG: hypothetical protein ACKVQQ_11920 [Burkholderiales bacterium]